MGPRHAARYASYRGALLVAALSAVAASYGAGQARTTTGANAELERLSAEARRCADRGDFRQAAANYRRILELRPDVPEVRANLGVMLHLQGEYEEAIPHFEAALAASPNLFVPNLFLGLDLVRVNRPVRAIRYLERAHQLDPRDEQAVLALARAHASMRRFEAANGWYEQAAVLNPKNADAWYGLGVTYLAVEREAMEELSRVAGKSSYALALFAESHEQQGRLDRAISLYGQALGASSTTLCLHSSLGFAYLKHGDASLAGDEFESELKDGSNCLMARVGLARLSSERGEFAPAMSELQLAWKADCNFVARNATLLWTALSDEKLDRWRAFLDQRALAAAEGSAERALVRALQNALAKRRANPDDTGTPADSPSGCSQATPNVGPVDAKSLWAQGQYGQCTKKLKAAQGRLLHEDLLLLAQCSFYSADYQTAFLASRQALARRPANLAGLYWRVKSAKGLAVDSLTRAYLAQPDFPGLDLLLAEADLAQGGSRAAEAEYRDVLRRKPDDVGAHFGLAMAYWKQFQLDSAVQELQTVLRLHPDDPEASYLMARILVIEQHYAEAIPFLRDALRDTSAAAPEAHALLGKIYARQGKDLEAIAELNQALVADRDGGYHYQLYLLYRKLGDEKSAAAALKEFRALRTNPH